MRQLTGRRRFASVLRHPAALVVGVFALSCLGDSSGPNVARPGQFSLAPSFESSAAGVVTIDRVRVLLSRIRSTSIALDTVIQINPTSSDVDFNLTVPVFTAADTFTATLALITPAGDTAFRGGPLSVIATPRTSAPPSTATMTLTYVGVGAGADSVVIINRPAPVFTGDTAQFQAVAYDNDVPVPGTPIAWSSLDPATASVPKVNVGNAVGGTTRGNARIVALLLTGPADTASVAVKLLPSTINVLSGNNQSSSIGSVLPAPLVVELKATDGLVVPGLWVKFAVTAGGGSASVDSVLSDANGQASVQWTLGSTPGSQQIRVTVSRAPTIQATVAATGITISAASFAVSGLPATSVAGTTSDIVVTAKDGQGNTVTDYNGTVHFTSTDPLAVLPSQYTFVQGDNGSHTFTAGVSLRTAGSRTVSVADIAAPSTNGGQTVTVQPGAPYAFGVTGLTNPLAAGGASNVTVTAKDIYGNTVTGYTGTIHFTTNDTLGTLPSDYTFVPGDNGTHLFTAGVTLKTAGGIVVTAKDVAVPSLTGAQGITVTPLAATHLAFTSIPGNTLAGGQLSPVVVVAAKDVYENTAISFTGAVTIAIGTNPAGGTLSGSPTTVNAVAGIATFGTLTINNQGSGYTLTASASGLTPVTSVAFDILAPTGTVVWVGGNGFWNDPTKWSTNAVPGPTDIASISAAGTYTVSVNQAVNVAGLTVGGGSSGTQTLQQNGYTVTMNGPGTVLSSGVLQAYGTIDGTGTLTNQGTINTYYGTLNVAVANQALLLLRGSNYLNGTITTTASSVIRAEADYSCCSSYSYVANGFTNNGAIELTAINGTGASSYINITAGILVNPAGSTIHAMAGTGGSREIDAQFDNQGTITIDAPMTINSNGAAHLNSGTINVAGGDLTLSQGGSGTPSFTNTGAITIGAGRTWTINYGTVNLNNGGTITGAGTLTTYSVTALNLNTNLSNASTALSLTYSTVNGPGTLTNAAGHTLTIYQSTIAAPFVNQGTLVNHSSNYFTGAPGSFTTTAASIIRVEGDYTCCSSNAYFTNGFTNNGAIELTAINGTGSSSYISVQNGTLVNAAGATIAALAGTGGNRQLDAAVNNQGTITIDAPFTMAGSNSVHANSGTININGADFTLNQGGTTPSFTNTGTVTIALGRTWTINNGALNQNSGTVGGAGTLNLYNVTANLATDFSNSVTGLALTYATVNGPGILTNAAGHTLTIYQSTISAPFANQGILVNRSSSTLGGAQGTFTTTASSIIRVEADYSCCSSSLYVTNGFTNNGAIELTAINGTGSSAYMYVQNGTLVNAAGATIAALPGTGGNRQLDAAVNNQGTITIDAPFTMAGSNSVHANSGTININGADFTLNQGGTTPSFTNTGTVTIALGRTWTINNGALNQNSGTVGGAGTLNLYNVTANLATDFSNSVTGLALTYATVNGPGILTNAAGHTLTIYQSTISAPFANQGTLVNHSNSTISSAPGTFSTAATSIIRSEGDANCCGSSIAFTNGFTNNGAIELTAINGAGTSAGLSVTNGTLVNAVGATITALAGSGQSRQLDAQIDNQGTLTINAPLTMSRNTSAHSNSGTIDILGGDFTLNQGGTTPSFTNTSAVNIGAGRTWTINNGTLSQSNGAIGGSGSLVLNSVTANLATDFSNATTGFNLNNSTVNGPGILTVAAGRTLTIQNTNIAAPLTISGTLVARSSSSFTGAGGTLTSSPGSTIRVEGDANCCGATLTVTNGFTNHGNIDLTAINGSGTNASLNVTNGSLTNASDGVINVLPGSGQSRGLGVELVNQGNVNINLSAGANQTLTWSRGSSATVNNGTITFSAGVVNYNQSGTSPSFTNNGTLTIGSGLTWTFNSGAFIQQTGATLNGGGILALTNVGNGTFNSGFTLGTLALTNGVTNFPVDISTATVALSLTNATLNGPGTLTNAAGQTLLLQNSDFGTTTPMPVVNQGTLVVHGSSNTITGPANTLTTATGSILRLEGAPSYGTGNLTVANSFTNNGTIEFTNILANQAAQLTVTTGTLTNTGTISSLTGLGGSSRTLNVALDNQAGASVLITYPLTMSRGSSVHTNAGTIDATAADWTLNSATSFTNTGTVTLGAGHTWTMNSGTLNQNGTLNGGGTLTLSSVTANFNNPFTLSALSFTNGVENFASGVNLSTATHTLTLTNTTLNGPGTLTNVTGQTLLLQNTDFGTTTSMPVVNQGTLVVHGSSNTITGPANTLTTATGSILRLEGAPSYGTGNLTAANSFTNNGTIEFTNILANQAAQLTVTTGTLTNAGTISSLPGLGGSSRTLNVALDNQAGASVLITYPLTMSRGSSVHTNAGTIDATAADWTLSSATSFTNSGTVTVGAGRTWTMNSGTLNQNGTLNGGGALTLSSVTANFNNPFTLSALSFTNGVENFAAGVNLSTASHTLTLTNTTLNGPGTLTNAAGQTLLLQNSDFGTTTPMPVLNQGTLVVHGSSNTVTGPANTLTTATGSTLLLEGAPSYGTGNLTVANGFTNNGTIDFTNILANQAAQLTVTTGTLTNAGTIRSLTGLGGSSRTLNAQLDNQAGASVLITYPLTMSRGSSVHTNAGTIDATAADWTLNSATSFTNTGTVTVGPGRTWTMNSGTLNQNGTLNGGGTANFSSVTNAAFNLPFALGTLGLSNTTANFASGVNLATSALAINASNSNLNGAGTLTNDGASPLTMIGGGIGMSFTNPGVFVAHASVNVSGLVSNTGTLRAEGSSSGTGTLTLPAGFTNAGNIELTNSQASQSATVAVTSGGALTNAATGSITSFPGLGGGSRTITGQLTNQGTMTVGGTGTAGSLTVTGTFTQQAPGGTLNMELGGTTAGTQYDQLVVNGTGTVALGGTLNVSLINAFVPALTNFNILTFGNNPTGQGFSPTNLPLLCVSGPQGSTLYQVQCP